MRGGGDSGWVAHYNRQVDIEIDHRNIINKYSNRLLGIRIDNYTIIDLEL